MQGVDRDGQPKSRSDGTRTLGVERGTLGRRYFFGLFRSASAIGVTM